MSVGFAAPSLARPPKFPRQVEKKQGQCSNRSQTPHSPPLSRATALMLGAASEPSSFVGGEKGLSACGLSQQKKPPICCGGWRHPHWAAPLNLCIRGRCTAEPGGGGVGKGEGEALSWKGRQTCDMSREGGGRYSRRHRVAPIVAAPTHRASSGTMRSEVGPNFGIAFHSPEEFSPRRYRGNSGAIGRLKQSATPSAPSVSSCHHPPTPLPSPVSLPSPFLFF
ncbi:hypothetical protein JZ751_022271 [Albula glossodonta]|uniref:Uncharacterized protein n=1 Tax=Albula glossodonta TaxID=121402 RepID=A0A8T2NJT8_9TELE|nr:hypothetical protein JZ751_022271 [Albula glossodonta]